MTVRVTAERAGVFDELDRLAKDLRVTRSDLVMRAIDEAIEVFREEAAAMRRLDERLAKRRERR